MSGDFIIFALSFRRFFCNCSFKETGIQSMSSEMPKPAGVSMRNFAVKPKIKKIRFDTLIYSAVTLQQA